MTTRIIDGRAEATRLVEKVKEQASAFTRRVGRKPGLAVVLIGEDPASAVYVGAKTRRAAEAGLASFKHPLPASITEAAVLRLLDQLNEDPEVDGILVQLPLPPHISTARVLDRIHPAKDVDGFHPLNAGLLATGQSTGLVPCTPLGCLRLIETVRPDLTGLNAVVIGRSTIVGRPAAQVLLNAGCSVTIVHRDSRDIPGHCRAADILLVAVGRAGLVRRDWVKPGAIVIDVGINRVATATGSVIVGDVAFDEVAPVAGAITPVPGGVGPMTVAALMENTVRCAEALAGPAEISAALSA
ncbi:MAG: bifunctional methylenetetrahydrofolate dehydrogenase/methenyltetrahydrofolate cyclohydrolase [Rhizobiales bacterium 24-66-13]|jgi:methylenetetrahydrofolate dehydrogenase (NADP+)/methenyltetrahydrofolate cyclohydrolase|nr:MAG: bifunctional methylenetetrahydrofolate dehydrogenase/methenyltetrahydrofolate cyclohydrolase [Rhizobiales bacterium 35-66-30]OYZ81764.1 MAG: bifunctional methylenetetrahydrofolate dehydrogenase/methenyltetrahydrofolate cyclohydrolase [Rhizobiales bacterium 24-66-13]OZB10073.1 MAG: bifunctional methylenetetrahydrofolate dehydrogenase/methenyltetrahydrofolate cyclohydrolase [Rhizobiales bacterium 39-66-18]HQS47233.1 bifunctional methylenetetrahydrofolate dehydrogenase/methenyltetrahydrofol